MDFINISMRKYFRSVPWMLLVIVLGAGILRVYRIAEIPPSLSWDEVSIGYNAYSILKTGYDEHHRFLPLSAFTAYGDYKPPVSVYLTVPFVLVFGLSELAVRLPSAVFGTITVFLTYFLVQALFTYFRYRRNDQKNLKGSVPDYIAIISVLLLAVSPWHINLSRAGFEANIALFFVVLGIWLNLKACQWPKLWITAWLPFVLAAYTFNSARYVVPILFIGLALMLRKVIRNHIRNFLLGILLALVFFVPLIPHLISPEARLRFTEVNIFSDPQVVEIANRRISESGNTWYSRIVFNRRIGYARNYLNHFFDHFDPIFLFIKGDGNPKFSTRDVGQLYIADAPLLALGLLAMSAVYPFMAVFLLFWLAAAIIPAATARETPHALRILNTLPVWQIFTAYGVWKLYDFISRRIRRKLIVRLVVAGGTFIYAAGIGYYLHGYYVHYPVAYAAEWQYGYKQALEYAASVSGSYDMVYVADAIGRPYMYTLFYNRTDPSVFWDTKQSYFDASGFYHVEGFGKYRFASSMPASPSGNSLFIANPGSVPEGAEVLKTVYLPNGTAVLAIYARHER